MTTDQLVALLDKRLADITSWVGSDTPDWPDDAIKQFDKRLIKDGGDTDEEP